MISYTVYVVDDEKTIREGIRIAFESKYRIEPFPDAESAIDALATDPPDLVLLDLGLPGMNGIEAISEIRRIRQEAVIIVITAYEDVASVVAAMKRGAFDYVVKPLHMNTLEVSIRNAIETIRLKKEVRALQERYLRENIPCFVGESHAIQDVMEFVRVLANSPDTPVLISGETGTGKELIASAVHYWSPNSAGPIVSVNCAAIPRELLESELFGYDKGAFTGANPGGKKGLVEQAAGGTLFLDEVGDLSMEAQAKLLRFLEEGEFYRVGGTRKLKVRARVVSATNKDLPSLIAKNVFREDLYYRLAVVKVQVPSLEQRRDDIVPIAEYFLVEFGKKFGKNFSGMSQEARAALEGHRWKGNVRELRNVIERAALVSKEAELSCGDLGLVEAGGAARGETSEGNDFPPIPPGGMDLDAFWQSAEKYYIEEALRIAGGNETKAAQLLNINHHTFRYRRRKLSG